MGIEDSCGAAILQQNAGVPDVSYTFDPTTGGLPNYFAAAPYSNSVETGPLVYFKNQYPAAIQKVGILAGSLTGSVGAQIALQVAAMKNLGYNIVYEDALSSVTPATVTPEIVRMEQAGVQFVAVTSINDTGVSAFLNAAQQQGWSPTVVWNTGTAYDTAFQKSIAPGAASNLVITTNLGPFVEGTGSSNLAVLFGSASGSTWRSRGGCLMSGRHTARPPPPSSFRPCKRPGQTSRRQLFLTRVDPQVQCGRIDCDGGRRQQETVDLLRDVDLQEQRLCLNQQAEARDLPLSGDDLLAAKLSLADAPSIGACPEPGGQWSGFRRSR